MLCTFEISLCVISFVSKTFFPYKKNAEGTRLDLEVKFASVRAFLEEKFPPTPSHSIFHRFSIFLKDTNSQFLELMSIFVWLLRPRSRLAWYQGVPILYSTDSQFKYPAIFLFTKFQQLCIQS